MKFKAVFNYDGVMLLEKRFIPAVEKLGKNCHLILTREEVILFQNAFSHDGPQALVQFPKEVLFEDYRINSQNEDRIAFVIDLSLLSRALKSTANTDGDKLQVKLVKKSQSATERASPFLSFEIKGQNAAIIQDIPISQPLNRLEVNDLFESIQQGEELPTALIQLPELVQLQLQVERLKNLGEILDVGISKYGFLTLTISTPLIAVTSEYTQLQIWGDNHVEPELSMHKMTSLGRLQKAVEEGNASSVMVNVKHFAKALFCHLTKPDTSFCGVAPNESCLLLMFQYPEGSISLQYRLPLLESGEMQ